MPAIDPLQLRPRLRLLRGGLTTIDQRWRYLLRSAHWRLYRNRDAGAWIDHPGGRLPLAPGLVVWLPAWGEFRSGCRGTVRHLFLHVAIDGLEGGWDRGLLAGPQPLPADPLLTALADRCEADSDAHVAEALAHAAFGAWRAGLPRARAAALQDRIAAHDPLLPALRLIEARIADPLPVRALAAACGCSDDTVARMMRRRLGASPAAWVRRRRCAHAADLLTTGDAPIEEIAAACGFANRYHFTRAFTRVMGSAPGAYRRMMTALSG